jgi:hypothetical protein
MRSERSLICFGTSSGWAPKGAASSTNFVPPIGDIRLFKFSPPFLINSHFVGANIPNVSYLVSGNRLLA